MTKKCVYYLDEVDALDDVDTEDDVDAELDVDALEKKFVVLLSLNIIVWTNFLGFANYNNVVSFCVANVVVL